MVYSRNVLTYLDVLFKPRDNKTAISILHCSTSETGTPGFYPEEPVLVYRRIPSALMSSQKTTFVFTGLVESNIFVYNIS